MFYTLSKALLFLLQPTIWILFLVVMALGTRSRRRKIRYVSSAVILFLILGNPALFNWTAHLLEYPKQKLELPAYEYAVVLGGFAEHNSNSQSIEFFNSADRLTEAMALYNEKIIRKIIVSSGVHEDGHPEQNEALIAKGFLIRTGIPSSDIIVEDRSWNTHQNALFTSEKLKELEFSGTILLITSAFHMERAIACFEKQGVKVNAYPVDYLADTAPGNWAFHILPDLDIIMQWQLLIKEKVGIIVYMLKGYI